MLCVLNAVYTAACRNAEVVKYILIVRAVTGAEEKVPDSLPARSVLVILTNITVIVSLTWVFVITLTQSTVLIKLDRSSSQ